MATVQNSIESAFSKMFKKDIKILASSRTDKGVHALAQKFTFSSDLNFLDRANFLSLINRFFKNEIIFKKIKKVSPNFHPINSVISKEYRYFIYLGLPTPFRRNYN